MFLLYLMRKHNRAILENRCNKIDNKLKTAVKQRGEDLKKKKRKENYTK